MRHERVMVSLMVAACIGIPVEGATATLAWLRPGVVPPAAAPAIAAGVAVLVVCLYLFGAGKRKR